MLGAAEDDDDEADEVESILSEAEVLRRAEVEKRREERARLIASLEREQAKKIKLPKDIWDFSIWTDDEIVDFFDSKGLVRPPPAGVDREGHGSMWPCSVCKQVRSDDKRVSVPLAFAAGQSCRTQCSNVLCRPSLQPWA